jgi:protein-tyrosine phosphatase
MPRRRAILLAMLLIAGIGLLIQRRQFPVRTTTWIPQDNRTNYSEIEPGLWMGGLVDEPPEGTLAVLSLCEQKDKYELANHKWAPIPDAAPAPPLGWLAAMVDFVETHRNEDRPVYVHCFAGVSRSGMVVTASLMQRHGWSRDRAIDFIRTRRPGIRPNPAFMERLLEWELTLDGAAVAETP